MRRSVRRILAGAAGLGLLATALTGVSQANAAPFVQMQCSSNATFSIDCWFVYGGTLGPITVKWFIDGNHVPAFNNKTVISFICFSDTGVRVEVTDNFGTGVDTEGPVCITQS